MQELVERRDGLRKELAALAHMADKRHRAMLLAASYLAPYTKVADPELGEGSTTIDDRDYPSLEEVNTLIRETAKTRNELANTLELLRQVGIF